VERRLTPELLDTLPHDHPDALHNRRDLRLINAFMGNVRWFVRTLPPLVGAGERVLELGAGLGELAGELARRGPHVDGLDRWPVPPDWPEGRTWHQTDLETFAGWEDYPVVIGNMILHQFEPDTLRDLGAHLDRHARLLVFCEPARRRRSQRLFAVAAPLMGANHVSRHDGHVSIAAGFLEHELPAQLGLAPDRWTWRLQTTFFGAYRLVAARRRPA
jgi:2-polyprenyl-3-methyl-5-hydroxy-6-metoxy-1,4-benzoquinol methylase